MPLRTVATIMYRKAWKLDGILFAYFGCSSLYLKKVLYASNCIALYIRLIHLHLSILLDFVCCYYEKMVAPVLHFSLPMFHCTRQALFYTLSHPNFLTDYKVLRAQPPLLFELFTSLLTCNVLFVHELFEFKNAAEF